MAYPCRTICLKIWQGIEVSPFFIYFFLTKKNSALKCNFTEAIRIVKHYRYSYIWLPLELVKFGSWMTKF